MSSFKNTNNTSNLTKQYNKNIDLENKNILLNKQIEDLKNEIYSLKNKNNDLQKKYDILNIENNKLNKELIDINNSYDILENEYANFKDEMSENIIVESMNDMKIQYENLKKNTVDIKLYKRLLKDNINKSKLLITLKNIIELVNYIITRIYNFIYYDLDNNQPSIYDFKLDIFYLYKQQLILSDLIDLSEKHFTITDETF